jgi:DNA-binding NarL/FixJ family response regulator
MASLAQAQAHLAAGRWILARDAFTAIVAQSDDPVALEGLSQAGWWLDEADTCVGARANAYRRYRELGDVRGAARTATALSWDSLLFGSGESVALGWFERARGLLEGIGESPEHGWLAVREAELALAVHHDPDRSFEAARRASAVAQRLGLGELEVVGLAMQGLALTNSGDVGLGMPSLDAAVAAATNGDVADLMWLGKVCCWLIVACNEVQDVARAGEWCLQVEALCTERDLMPLFNVCRIEHASVQAAQGTWRDAEREFQAALGRLAHSSRSSRTEAIVHLGELRRRQGRFAEADELLAQDEFNPTAVVGRAQIRLQSGDSAGASSAIAAALVSIPSGNRIARAKLLLPAVRAAHAQGDGAAAAAATAELRATADEVGTDPLLGLAACAEAVLADPAEAAALLREAVRRFHRASLRYDGAEARMALAEALVAAGEEASGREQLAIVEAAFVELSAAAGLAQVRRLRAVLEGQPGPLTPREVEVLRLVSQGMSNRVIADELVVSEHTVHRHVANILTKLDESSRSAAVAHAIGAGLI